MSVEETVKLIRAYRKNEISAKIAACGTRQIETERLILRPFCPEDAGSAFKNWAGIEAVQNMYGEPAYKTIGEVKELLGKYITGYVTGYTYRWAVTEKGSGECIGQIAYFLVDQNNRWGEIEYCIGTAYQGKGYATEATKAVIDYGFHTIGFHKVQICVRPSNIRSKRVIEKCGFAYEGMLRDYFLMNGKYEGRMYFSLLAP
ncbi:MAG: GNAT family N-acetyltransferase [Lachnospiraceae bacterium]|nr:GNAT family N-acetyltransferase [Lachnospiraceae bacterium]